MAVVRKYAAVKDNAEQNEKLNKKIEDLKEGDLVTTPGAYSFSVEEPPWLDKKKFYRAGKIYKDHFGGINFSHICGLLLSFYFSKNIETLAATGWSSNTKKLYQRYVATAQHIQSWYEGDVWDSTHPSRRSLFIVRSMHTRAANKMLSTKNNGTVYISQWDMAITQWAFIGPLLLYPNKFGLRYCPKEDFECLIHFWKGIGYLLGLEDKYNLCGGTYSDVVKACKHLQDEYREKVIISNPASESMAESVTVALSKVDIVFTWGFLANYIHELIKLPCPIGMGILDWIAFRVTDFMLSVVNTYSFPRLLLNEFARWKLERAYKEVGAFEKLNLKKTNNHTINTM